jgi:hypothetical protein
VFVNYLQEYSWWGTATRSSTTSELSENPTENLQIANIDRYLQIILLSIQKLKRRAQPQTQDAYVYSR